MKTSGYALAYLKKRWGYNFGQDCVILNLVTVLNLQTAGEKV